MNNLNNKIAEIETLFNLVESLSETLARTEKQQFNLSVVHFLGFPSIWALSLYLTSTSSNIFKEISWVFFILLLIASIMLLPEIAVQFSALKQKLDRQRKVKLEATNLLSKIIADHSSEITPIVGAIYEIRLSYLQLTLPKL